MQCSAALSHALVLFTYFQIAWVSARWPTYRFRGKLAVTCLTLQQMNLTASSPYRYYTYSWTLNKKAWILIFAHIDITGHGNRTQVKLLRSRPFNH